MLIFREYSQISNT